MSTRLKISVSAVVLDADKRLLKKALRDIGKEIEDKAKGLIKNSVGGPGQPPKEKTGNLSASLSLTVKNSGLSVSDRAYYALALEDGASGTTRRSARNRAGKNNWSMPAHPFLSTALELVEENIAEKVGKAITDGISLKTK